jgi:hypothetical protein
MYPIKLCESHEKPFDYIVGLLEKKVRFYASSVDNDLLDQDFLEQDWTKEVADVENDLKILTNVGVKIYSLISVDVINTPEVEEFNRKVQEADNEGKVIDKQINNKVKLENGQGRVLDERILNMTKNKTIAQENDEILKHTIETIKKTSDVRGDVALRFIIEKDKHATVRESAQVGSIVYIENGAGGSSNASVGAGLTWGINAANSASAKKQIPSISKDRDKKNLKNKVKVKGKVRDDDDDDDDDD